MNEAHKEKEKIHRGRLLWWVVFSPRRAIAELASGNYMREAIALFILVSWLLMLEALMANTLLNSILIAMGAMIGWSIALLVIARIVCWVLRLLGAKRGTPDQLVSVIGFCNIIYLIIWLILVIGFHFTEQPTVYEFVGYIELVWTLLLQRITLEEVFGFSQKQALQIMGGLILLMLLIWVGGFFLLRSLFI